MITTLKFGSLILGTAYAGLVAADTVISESSYITIGAAIGLITGAFWLGSYFSKQKAMHMENRREIHFVKTMARKQEYLTNLICYKLGIDTSKIKNDLADFNDNEDVKDNSE